MEGSETTLPSLLVVGASAATSAAAALALRRRLLRIRRHLERDVDLVLLAEVAAQLEPRDRDDLAAALDLLQEILELLDRQLVERERRRARDEAVARLRRMRRDHA